MLAKCFWIFAMGAIIVSHSPTQAKAQAQAQVLGSEIVELGTIAINNDSNDRRERYATLVRDGCGFKGIAFGQRKSVRFDLKGFIVSYNHGRLKDEFREYATLRNGSNTGWYVLRQNAPCITKVYVIGEANVADNGRQMKIIVWGLR